MIMIMTMIMTIKTIRMTMRMRIRRKIMIIKQVSHWLEFFKADIGISLLQKEASLGGHTS